MRHLFLTAPLAFAWVLAITTSAPTRATAADLSACGPFDFRSGASCELKFGGGCEIECAPLNVAAACEASCQGKCNLDLDVDCNLDCNAGCEAECKIDPGKFDCEAECNASCGGSCEAKCASSSDKTQCKATCSGTCGGSCDAKCSVTPPSADCKAKCSASCEGSCKAQANLDCRIDCEGGCQVEVSGGCKAQCAKPEGALFCNGQYVDADDVSRCIEALASIEIEVSGYAECKDNTCTAEGSVSCATSPLAPGGRGASGLVAATLVGLAIASRRRRGT